LQIRVNLVGKKEEEQYMAQARAIPGLVEFERTRGINPLEKYVILDTGGLFDNLPEYTRVKLMEGMGEYLKEFSNDLLTALTLSIGRGSVEGMKPIKAISKGLEVMHKELGEVISESSRI